MFNINKARSKKYFLLSALFACASAFGVVAGSKAIIAQIQNIYNQSSDQIAGLNSLMSAVASNDVDGVRFFSKAGASLINQKNVGGATALLIAARQGNFDICNLLIANGAEVNTSDNEGWTPLMRASLIGASNVVELLLSKNSDASLVNTVNESAIVHAAYSDCSQCLNLMFEKFNFVKLMDVDLLKSQINDAYVVARNHDNQEIQTILEKNLDQVIKLSILTKPQSEPQNNVAEGLGTISISEDNQLNLVTKNKSSSFVERDLSEDNKKSFKGKGGKFKFVGESVTNYQTPETSSNFAIIDKSDIANKSNKNGKFVITSGAAKNLPPKKSAEAIKFKPNDSNAVFLQNSKINNEPVTQILKSKKFKLQQGPNPTPTAINSTNNDDAQTTSSSFKFKTSEAAKKTETPVQSTKVENPTVEEAPTIPPIVNSFKLLKGPKGQAVEKKVEVEKGDEIDSAIANSNSAIANSFSNSSKTKSSFKFSKGPSAAKQDQ